MSLSITVPYTRTFASPRTLEETFGYLAQLEQSVPENFPGVERFNKDPSGLYFWQFQKVGHGGHEVAIKLLTNCATKPPKLIEVQSIEKPGYSRFSGKWDLTSGFDGCQVKFTASIGLELPIPFLMKAVAAPLVEKEFTKFFDRYIERVEKNLSK